MKKKLVLVAVMVLFVTAVVACNKAEKQPSELASQPRRGRSEIQSHSELQRLASAGGRSGADSDTD
jgi:hypothetical protein